MKLKETEISIIFEREGEKIELIFSLIKQNDLYEAFESENKFECRKKVFECLKEVRGDIDCSLEDLQKMNFSDMDFLTKVFSGYMEAIAQLTLESSAGAERKN